ncbi:hypothetical protein A9Q96_14075 [Rhodobacterales bacterium 52_120_T64]|nr:hypothetical protein A9Q96_14075 [Rhodobacterales bacterium 52_120_T64]
MATEATEFIGIFENADVISLNNRQILYDEKLSKNHVVSSRSLSKALLPIEKLQPLATATIVGVSLPVVLTA